MRILISWLRKTEFEFLLASVEKSANYYSCVGKGYTKAINNNNRRLVFVPGLITMQVAYPKLIGKTTRPNYSAGITSPTT